MNMMSGLNRKPIFDNVREILGRAFTQAEVDQLDRAIDVALGKADLVQNGSSAPRLGALSERFESGGRGPGTVSSGQDDPGGVSYGIYQLASRTGTVAKFVAAEGAAWSRDFHKTIPGSRAFSAAWRAIAERDTDTFADAQHAFIRRTHYAPAVRAVMDETGLDLDVRHQAVRDATWSVSVQHGGAARILVAAIGAADKTESRDSADYDRTLVQAIYDARKGYVLRVADRSGSGARRTLQAITRNRYPAELRAALAMFDGEDASA